MTRGKYAAKAANRRAAFDNELLTQAHAEIAALKHQLAERSAELHAARVDRDALVIKRAEELSQRLVDAAHAEAADLQQRLTQLGLGCWTLFKKYRCVVREGSADDFLREYSELFGLGNQIHELFKIRAAAASDAPAPSRRARRRSLKKLDQLRSETEQARAHHGVVQIGWAE